MEIPFLNSQQFTWHRLSSVGFGDGIPITHVLCHSIECREILKLFHSFSSICTNCPLIYCYLSNVSLRMAYRVPVTIVCKQHDAYVRLLDKYVGWKFLGRHVCALRICVGNLLMGSMRHAHDVKYASIQRSRGTCVSGAKPTNLRQLIEKATVRQTHAVG